MKRKKTSKNWLIKRNKDLYFRESKVYGYRSRSAFKLIEMNNKFKFLNKNILLLQRIMNSSSVDKNLKKGYAIIKKDKTLIKSIKSLKNLDQFSVIMNDGKILIQK